MLFPAGERERAIAEAAEALGEPERISCDYRWDYTDYYSYISPELVRIFISFCGTMHPGELADKKLQAVRAEAASMRGGCRSINIDPGYLDGARLVLASTKDNAQRIYLRDGIFAEVTMTRDRSGWVKYPYTFPDFKSGAYDAFFDQVRIDWRKDIKK